MISVSWIISKTFLIYWNAYWWERSPFWLTLCWPSSWYSRHPCQQSWMKITHLGVETGIKLHNNGNNLLHCDLLEPHVSIDAYILLSRQYIFSLRLKQSNYTRNLRLLVLVWHWWLEYLVVDTSNFFSLIKSAGLHSWMIPYTQLLKGLHLYSRLISGFDLCLFSSPKKITKETPVVMSTFFFLNLWFQSDNLWTMEKNKALFRLSSGQHFLHFGPPYLVSFR